MRFRITCCLLLGIALIALPARSQEEAKKRAVARGLLVFTGAAAKLLPADEVSLQMVLLPASGASGGSGYTLEPGWEISLNDVPSRSEGRQLFIHVMYPPERKQ